MKEFKSHLINHSATIIEALTKLNVLIDNLTLFVIDDDGKLIGTLTDGDVRRGFVKGMSLEESVVHFMPKTFFSIKNNIDVRTIKKYKEIGINLLPLIDNHGHILKVYNLQCLKSILPLDVVIMAGGRGERLKPMTDRTPKPMLKIGNKPIIEYNIDRLIQYGIETIYISVRYLSKQIIEYFGNGDSKNITIKYLIEEEPLGTIGALSTVSNFHQDVLVVNSDLFTNIDYEDLYLAYLENNADMAIATIPYTINIPYAILQGSNIFVKRFREKPQYTYNANAGIYILNKDIIEMIPKHQFYKATDLIKILLKLGKKVIYNPIVGFWIDIGNLNDFKRAQEIAQHQNN